MNVIFCKLKNRKNGVKINIKTYVNENTLLEGKNVVHRNSNIMDSDIGYATYIGPDSILNNAKIGRFCSISSNVKVIAASHPSNVFVSTHPSFYSVKKQSGFTFVKKQIFEENIKTKTQFNVIIGNDVWIGTDVKIMGGVEISDGCIIAAGSIVTKNLEPYSIVGGIPAKHIKYRFSNEEILFLSDFKWWNQNIDWIKSNYMYFVNIKEFKKKFKNINT